MEGVEDRRRGNVNAELGHLSCGKFVDYSISGLNFSNCVLERVHWTAVMVTRVLRTPMVTCLPCDWYS